MVGYCGGEPNRLLKELAANTPTVEKVRNARPRPGVSNPPFHISSKAMGIPRRKCCVFEVTSSMDEATNSHRSTGLCHRSARRKDTTVNRRNSKAAVSIKKELK